MGIQTWNAGRLVNWIATYVPGGNGLTQQLNQLPDNFGNLTELSSLYIEKHNCNKDINNTLDSINCNSKVLFILLEKSNPDKQYIMIHELDPNQHTNIIQEINDKTGVPELVD